MVKISIIVPIYNVEIYLCKCLDSIIGQTYKNIEIILINDGSTDNCLEICNKYKKRDKRIIVIDKENGGLSDARNTGIEIATGDYLMFIDSDDWIYPDMAQRLYSLVHKNNACIAQCNFIRLYDEKKVNINQEKEEISIMDNKQGLESMYGQNGIKSVVVWNKIYKKKLFDEIRFPAGKLHEDEFTTYKIFDKCEKIVDTNETMYYYRQRSDSIMNKNFSISRFDAIDAIEERINYFKKKDGYLDLKLYTQKQLSFLLRYFYIKTYESDIKKKDMYLKGILYKVKKNYFEFMLNKYISKKAKIIINIMLFCPNIFYKIYKHRI